MNDTQGEPRQSPLFPVLGTVAVAISLIAAFAIYVGVAVAVALLIYARPTSSVVIVVVVYAALAFGLPLWLWYHLRHHRGWRWSKALIPASSLVVLVHLFWIPLAFPAM